MLRPLGTKAYLALALGFLFVVLSVVVVVLDLVMPQMGGEKCLEELIKLNPHVKVLVSTGHSLDARERVRVGSMAKGFVNKPYEVRQLVQGVKRVLDAGGPTE